LHQHHITSFLSLPPQSASVSLVRSTKSSSYSEKSLPAHPQVSYILSISTKDDSFRSSCLLLTITGSPAPFLYLMFFLFPSRIIPSTWAHIYWITHHLSSKLNSHLQSISHTFRPHFQKESFALISHTKTDSNVQSHCVPIVTTLDA